MACYTREQIESAVKAKGYKWFTSDNYDVNIVGVNNSINRYNALVKDAIIALDKISFNSKSHNYLKDLAEYIIKREK